MKLARHKIDVDHVRELYDAILPGLSEDISSARRDANNLSMLALMARKVYRCGSVVAPDASEVAEAILIAAQANCAIALLSSPRLTSRQCKLGEDLVEYRTTVDESTAHLGVWLEGYYQAAISRQRDLMISINDCSIIDALRKSSSIASDEAMCWVKILHQLALGKLRGSEEFREFCDILHRSATTSSFSKAVKALSLPCIPLLEALDDLRELDFEAHLVTALVEHKKFWSSKQSLRKELEGLVSLTLTGLASIAWDRGLRFQVDSDYLPWSWVTGKFFTANRQLD